jgi:hypothetical protein
MYKLPAVCQAPAEVLVIACSVVFCVQPLSQRCLWDTSGRAGARYSLSAAGYFITHHQQLLPMQQMAQPVVPSLLLQLHCQVRVCMCSCGLAQALQATQGAAVPHSVASAAPAPCLYVHHADPRALWGSPAGSAGAS